MSAKTKWGRPVRYFKALVVIAAIVLAVVVADWTLNPALAEPDPILDRMATSTPATVWDDRATSTPPAITEFIHATSTPPSVK